MPAPALAAIAPIAQEPFGEHNKAVLKVKIYVFYQWLGLIRLFFVVHITQKRHIRHLVAAFLWVLGVGYTRLCFRVIAVCMNQQNGDASVQQHIFGYAVVHEVIPKCAVVRDEDQEINPVFVSIVVQSFHHIIVHYFAENEGHLGVGIHIIDLKEFLFQFHSWFTSRPNMHKMQLAVEPTGKSYSLFDRWCVKRFKIAGIQNVGESAELCLRGHEQYRAMGVFGYGYADRAE